MIRYAMQTYGFLIPWNESITSKAFGVLIQSYSCHPRSQVIAQYIQSLDCVFIHLPNRGIGVKLVSMKFYQIINEEKIEYSPKTKRCTVGDIPSIDFVIGIIHYIE